MIQKAIEKIDEEIKTAEKFTAYIRTLGKYIKSELLTSDSNAVKILAPNTDLETFMERVFKLASSMRSVKSDNNFSEAGKKAIAEIKGVKPEEVEADPGEIETIGKLYAECANGKQDNGVCLSSEIIVPLLHIYYGIPLEAAEKDSAPKRRRFSTVSLD